MTDTARTEATVRSADGSLIAYDVQGSGSTVILLGQAFADRKDHRRLAAALAPHHTVINHDRRGRGASTEAGPWSLEREVDDLAALIDAHGGSASLIGASAGAVLALEAAARLGDRTDRVVAFEAPVIIDGDRSPVPREFSAHLGDLVREGHRSQAVAEFFRTALGVSPLGVRLTRLMFPMWRGLTRMAHTTEYDLALCHGLQDGKPLPVGRWDGIQAEVLVLAGGRSEPFMVNGARAIADQLDAECVIIPKAHHATLTMQPRTALPTIREFLSRLDNAGDEGAKSV